MPSHLHEVLIEMFRDRPALAAELLSGPLGLPVPVYEQAVLSSAELTDVTPTEYRADATVTFSAGDEPVLAVVVEVQLRADARKRRTWPAYVATLYARLGCPVTLLVMCPDVTVAAWCAKPIVVSDPGLTLTPLVLGPADIPLVSDPVAARRSPQLAVLSAMSHGAGPGREGVLGALLAALDVVDHDHADLYADMVLTVLPAAARVYLEALMTITGHRYQSDFARRYFDAGKEKGRAEGEALAVLAVLAARGIVVPEHIRERITRCTDLDQLDLWIRLAATADAADDLFA
jgi:hypothetical protein